MIVTRTWIVLIGLILACHTALAYDPLFMVTEIEGACSVLKPGATEPIPARAKRAYPYGTQLLTGMAGKIRLLFGEGSACIIGPSSKATLTEDDGNADWKQVHLDLGSASLELMADFNENGSDRVTVVTLGAIGEPTQGGEYEYTVRPQGDLVVASFHTVKGEMTVYDNHLFTIPALKNDNRAEISALRDRSYIRYRNIRGKQLVDLNNVTTDDGTPRIAEMQPNSMLKMWREKSTLAGAWVVSMLIINADGSLRDAIHYKASTSNNWN